MKNYMKAKQHINKHEKLKKKKKELVNAHANLMMPFSTEVILKRVFFFYVSPSFIFVNPHKLQL
jgi:hypothetical protein